MLTLEEIKNVTFTKTRGGYATAEVDDFIDKCVEAYASLMEERNTSNKKLEVLADKLVEYRNDEDSIRSALVNAQRLGDTIVREANQKAVLVQEDAAIKAEKIVADAQAKADNILGNVTDEVKAEQAQLERMKHEVAVFKERMLSIYKEHLSLIDLLPEEPAPENKPEEARVAEESGVSNAATEEISAEEKPETDVLTAEETVEETAEAAVPLANFANEQVDFAVSESVAAEQPEKEQEMSARFENLKFGDDYIISNDSEDEKNSGKGGFFHRKR